MSCFNSLESLFVEQRMENSGVRPTESSKANFQLLPPKLESREQVVSRQPGMPWGGLGLHPTSQKWADVARVPWGWRSRKRHLLQWLLSVPVTQVRTRTVPHAWCCLYKTTCSGQAARMSSFGRCMGVRAAGVPAAREEVGLCLAAKWKQGTCQKQLSVSVKCSLLRSSGAFLFFCFVFPLCGVSQSFECTRNVGG